MRLDFLLDVNLAQIKSCQQVVAVTRKQTKAGANLSNAAVSAGIIPRLMIQMALSLMYELTQDLRKIESFAAVSAGSPLT